MNTLALGDTLALGLSDAVTSLIATLNRNDTLAVIVIDSAVPIVNLATADVIVIGLGEAGQTAQVFLNRLDSVLVAQVVYLSGERTTRAMPKSVQQFLAGLRTVDLIVRSIQYLSGVRTVVVI